MLLNNGRLGVQREEIRQRVPGQQGIGVLALLLRLRRSPNFDRGLG